MNTYVALTVCVLGALLMQALQRAYFSLPQKELKRHVDRAKPEFRRLLMVSKYGATARVFLTSIEFVFAASAVIIASRAYDPLVALLVLAVLAGLVKLAASKNTTFAMKLAASLAPYIAKPLYYVEPLVQGVKDVVPALRQRRRQKTDMFETEDLQDLIKLQQRAPNNRIPHPELIAALNSLEFGAKQVKHYMIRRARVRFVNAKDPIGPILLSELHKTGLACFPVQGNSEEEIDGMLYLEDVTKHTEGGVVSQAMDPKVVYVRDDRPLEEVLQAFSKTGRHEFMVVNTEAKITGMITLKEVLEQMIGHSVRTDFEDYGDPSTVASLE